MSGPALTAPRKGGLLVLLDAHPEAVRVSNTTINKRSGDRIGRAVYWQTARWLVEQGYATAEYRDSADHLTLTKAGLALANGWPQ